MKISEEDLKNQIRENSLSGVYYLFGEENFLTEFYINKLFKMAEEKDSVGFNTARFNGRELNSESVADFAEGLPVMGNKKYLFIDDLDSETLPANDMDALKAALSDLPETTAVFVSTVNSPVNVKRSSKAKSFVSFMEKTGSVLEFAKKDKPALIKYISGKVKKAGGTISAVDCNLLCELSGNDLTYINNETDKLIAYRPGAEISHEDVLNLCVPVLDNTVFDLSRAILSRQSDRAFSLLQELLAMKQEPVAILGAVSMTFIDLYRAQAAKKAGKTVEDIVKLYDYRGKEFRIRNAYRDCGRYGEEFIRKSLAALVKADRLLKSSRLSSRTVLEQAFAEILKCPA